MSMDSYYLFILRSKLIIKVHYCFCIKKHYYLQIYNYLTTLIAEIIYY